MDWDGENQKFIRNHKIFNFIREKYNIGSGVGPGNGQGKFTLGHKADQCIGIDIQSE